MIPISLSSLVYKYLCYPAFIFFLITNTSLVKTLTAQEHISDSFGTVSFVMSGKPGFFEDKTKNLKLIDIINKKIKFETTNITSINNSALWYRFRITENKITKTQSIIQIDCPCISKVEFYYRRKAGNYTEKRAGTVYPMSQWEIKERMPVFYIPENSDDRSLLYVRIESQYNFVPVIKIMDENSFHSRNKDQHFLFGCFYGIILIMLIFNSLLYISTKKLDYLFYIFFLFSYGLLESVIDGFAFQFFWPEIPKINSFSFSICSVLYLLSGSLFIKSFMNTRNISLLLNVILNLIILSSILVIGLTFIIHELWIQLFGFYLLPVFVLLQLLITCRAVSRGFKPARIYLLGLFPMVVVASIELLWISGFITSSDYLQFTWQITSILQMCFISFALGNNIKVLAKEKRKEIDKVRNDIFRNLHDDIGNNLASMYIMSQRLLGEPMPPNYKLRLMEITDTISTTSDSLREIIWFNNPENYSLENFILHLKNIAGKTLVDINFNFDIGPISCLQSEPFIVQRNLYLMFKEILGNILKHSLASNVFIEIKEENDYLVFSIRDDGKGFDTENCYDGMGLKNLRLRASEINSSLVIISKPETGTEVIIRVKITHLRDGKFIFPGLNYLLKKTV